MYLSFGSCFLFGCCQPQVVNMRWCSDRHCLVEVVSMLCTSISTWCGMPAFWPLRTGRMRRQGLREDSHETRLLYSKRDCVAREERGVKIQLAVLPLLVFPPAASSSHRPRYALPPPYKSAQSWIDIISHQAASNYFVGVQFQPCDTGFEWLQSVVGIISDIRNNGASAFGSCEAWAVDRTLIPDLYGHVGERLEITGDLAFTLFDRHGRLTKVHKDHAVKKGSGTWGSEMDYGHLLVLAHVAIHESYRRGRLGQCLVQGFLRSVTKTLGGAVFAIALPRTLVAATRIEFYHGLWSRELQNESEIVFTKFIRAAGFRRIGLSPYFALATDSNHPCHQLPAQNDPDPGVSDTTNDTSLGELEAQIEKKRVWLMIFNEIGHRSDDFLGFPDDIVTRLATLRGFQAPTDDQRSRLKYGCTCGKCIGGFLSARMQLSVKTKAEECLDTLTDMLETIDTQKPSPRELKTT
ncbi:hypothetical protein CC86DRAFT_423219 [Ophiobolus disseminans]|uniref:Uncharacterized protein n=1 Tax=Ophiobolus disseminans TaxID=1469910 RepID=A0A6A6ZPS5_9PLEO|nr:hypothetical protein CC86DRAFT_423219 [Ophiobolus disseminans]